MQSPKSQLQMRNMHHVKGNIEMDLSLEQLLASGKLFFNRACFNVPVHVCYCILDVFLFSSFSGLSELHCSHHMMRLLMVCCIVNFLTILHSWFSKIQQTAHLVDLPHIKIKCRSVSCNFLWTFSCLSFWSSWEELIACTNSLQFSYLSQVEAAADPQNN